MMARTKRIYILMIKVNSCFSFSSPRYFLKEIENMFSVFLSSYRNTSESLGEQEMLWEHEPQASISTAFSSSPKLSHVFYFLNGFFYVSVSIPPFPPSPPAPLAGLGNKSEREDCAEYFQR